MGYQVNYTPQAVKDLQKMDTYTRALIFGWIDKNLVGCSNPRQREKGLTANKSGQWRYRVGNYRLIADISEETITILILTVGHRENIYKGGA